MAVYKRTYTRYAGPLTNERWRFAILLRYSLQSMFGTRLRSAALIVALVPHLIALVMIYLRSHIDALLALGIDAQGLEYLSIDGGFFFPLFIVETFISFFLIAFSGPSLVSPDLANGAL